MGAGASAAVEIEEYEAKYNNSRALSDVDKQKIQDFRLCRNESLYDRLEVLKIDDTLSKEVREFVEYKLQKIATEVATQAINQAAALLVVKEKAQRNTGSYGHKCDEEGERVRGGTNKK